MDSRAVYRNAVPQVLMIVLILSLGYGAAGVLAEIFLVVRTPTWLPADGILAMSRDVALVFAILYGLERR